MVVGFGPVRGGGVKERHGVAHGEAWHGCVIS